MEETQPTVSSASPSPKQKMNLSLDLRWVVLALAAVIVIMLLLWAPWHSKPGTNARTISVTGDATVKAEPDEYVFYPSYQFTNADKAAAIKAASDKSSEVVAGLKKAGVADKQIKTSVNGYQNGNNAVSDSIYPRPTGDGEYIYTLQVTVTLPNRSLAQKVQDYLTTTSPSGEVTPTPNFSETKRKQLENQARDTATKAARAKADQSAKNLGFKVGSVKSVDDGEGFGGIYPVMGRATSLEDKATAAPSLSVQPGENDLKYSVTVVYYIK